MASAELIGPQGPAGAESRGESMVKKHHERIEAEREEAAIGHLQASLPRLCKKVLALALHDCRMDAERALMLLRQFQADCFERLEELIQKRKKGGVEHKDRAHEAALGGSASDGSDSGDRKHRKRSKSSKSKKDGKHSKHKKKGKEKKIKKRRRHDSDDDEDAARPLYGAWGILRESDYHSKKPEFQAWASEVKHIDVEGLPRVEERELFRSFMEDYNTCSMPTDKYYDLDIYERKKAAEEAKRAAAAGAQAPAGRNVGSFMDDERLRRAEMMQKRQREMDQGAHLEYQRRFMTGDAMKELKAREMIQLQMQDAYKMGDMEKAARLKRRLNPEDNNEEERNPLDG